MPDELMLQFSKKNLRKINDVGRLEIKEGIDDWNSEADIINDDNTNKQEEDNDRE